MKKLLLCILLFFCSSVVFSQLKKTTTLKTHVPAKAPGNSKDLQKTPQIGLSDEIKTSAIDVIKKAAKNNVVHDILFGINMPSDNIPSEKMAELLRLRLEVWNEQDSIMNSYDANQLKKNLPVFSEYFDGVKMYGNMFASYNFINKSAFPVGFGHFNNGLTFVQYGVFSDIKYNTVKMVADDRAIASIKRVLLPSLFNFQPLLKIKEIQNFCLVTGYTAQNFEDKYFHEGETSAIIISREVLEKFINAELSENEILSMVSFFSSNKNTNGNLKKLTL